MKLNNKEVFPNSLSFNNCINYILKGIKVPLLYFLPVSPEIDRGFLAAISYIRKERPHPIS